jgi:homoserine kinase
MPSVEVFAPATVANVSCGYDVLGFALEEPGDRVVMSLNHSGRITLDRLEGDEGKLPLDPEKNLVTAVVSYYLKHIGSKQGVSVELYKQMPFGSGLGSSSASSVAGLVAINHLMGNPLKREELLPLAMEGERMACGNAHADNVAPSLLGGLILIRSYNPLDIVRLPYPEELTAAVLYPHVEIPTSQARRILKNTVPISDAIRQWGNVAGLVAGFCMKDIALIGRSMEDYIIEPVRAMLIPCFYEMRSIATENGAIGFGISGSGPSVFALCENEKTAAQILEKLSQRLEKEGILSNRYISGINRQGATVIK